MTTEIHVSIDIGSTNFGVSILEVDKYDWSWKEIPILATFDLTEGSETGGKKTNSIISKNVVEILDSLVLIKRSSIILIEEQYINTFGNKFMMNNMARNLQYIVQGYFIARMKDWNRNDIKIYLIPSRLKLRDCPKSIKKSKPKYKEWTKWVIVDYLREMEFEDEAVLIENLKKGDEAGDTIKQYKEAIIEIANDENKYRW